MQINSLIKASVLAIFGLVGPALAENAWETIPDPASLPQPALSGTAAIGGETVYFETHGTTGPWIIFLHGGTGSVLDWGSQVPAFAEHNRVLLIESRAHGRSTWDGTPLSYDRMASDVIVVMDALGIESAPMVGWSDGGNVALIVGINHPDRVQKIVTSGSNADPAGIDLEILKQPPYSTPDDRF